MQKLKIGVTFACLLVAGGARATVLNPGDGDTFPDVFPAADELALMTSHTGSFATPSPATKGTFTDGVFKAGPNVVCPAGGCLDFVYQFSVALGSANPLLSLSGSDFTGVKTDVGFVVDGSSLPGGKFVTGDIVNFAGAVARPSAGSVIFKFGPPNAPLQHGDTSAVLIIQTNATKFIACDLCVGVVGGGPTTNVSGFQPVPPVPEPGFYGLLAIGLAILSWSASRRRQAARS